MEIVPRFNGAPLVLEDLALTNAAGQRLSVTRLDFLLSDFALRGRDGKWLERTNWQAYFSFGAKRMQARVPNLPPSRYDRVRFHVGVTSGLNYSDPAQYAPDHPLNPELNGLHWGWAGGYVFFAIEGRWEERTSNLEIRNPKARTQDSKSQIANRKSQRPGYSYHLGNDWMLMTVELPVELNLTDEHTLPLALNAECLFAGVALTDETSSTHSRAGDKLAEHLRRNVEGSFLVWNAPIVHTRLSPSPQAPPSGRGSNHVRASGGSNRTRLSEGGLANPLSLGERDRVRGKEALEMADGTDVAEAASASQKGGLRLISPNATPYRFTFARQFPPPPLPRDNPLTEQGVELGRKLFNEPLLSINGQQSCATCHQPEAMFTDAGRAFSLGAEGKAGTRNAMPLFNLAWKRSFFWDGRARTLREQVLMPIQNPIEMHESLSNVVGKLTATGKTAGPKVPRAPFPLTPALSLGEREPCQPAPGKPDAHGQVQERMSFPPLLKGEGWGEGENRPGDFEDVNPGPAADRHYSAFRVPPSAFNYPALFERAFGSPGITADRVARALEQFLLTLVSYDSKFDRAVQGRAQLGEEEKRGFQLFMTEYDPRSGQYGADCFHCHGGPFFTHHGFANNGLDPEFTDAGLAGVTGKEYDRGRFSVPSLRNVELTGPYMHDGRFKSLAEVIDHYSAGVKRSPSLDPNLAKHPTRGLQLAEPDKQALVAFLKTLTDETRRAKRATASTAVYWSSP